MKTIIFCVILFLTSTASGTIALDQVTTDIDKAFTASAVGRVEDREIETAQTVTMGVAGYLSQIDVWVGRQEDADGDLVLSILRADYSPTVLLASFSVSSDMIETDSLFEFTMVTFDVRSANIFLDHGESFAVSLSAPDTPVCEASYWPPFSWSLQFYSQYDEGMRFTREIQNGLSWNETSIADQSLRTWVEPAPEPATVALLLLGAGFLVCGKKVRK